MKSHELRDLSMSELEARLKDEKQALVDFKFNKAIAGQIENPARIKSTRREISRLTTIINEKKSAE
jgi:large subunit ribosomal protein L29